MSLLGYCDCFCEGPGGLVKGSVDVVLWVS